MAFAESHFDNLMRNKSRLRVCLASSQSSWHGGERQMLLLAKGLERRGHAVLSLVQANSDVAARMRNAECDLHEFSGRGRSPNSLFGIRKALRQFEPDVLLYNDSHALISAGIAGWRLPIATRVLSRRVAFPLRSSKHIGWLADRVICVSRSVREICRAAGVDDSMLSVVHDGVEPESLRRSFSSTESIKSQFGNRTLLITVANLAECKGHRYFLHAMPKIVEHFPDALWLLAGDGKQRSMLERGIADLKLENHVKLLGYRDDTSDLLRAADAMIIPSHTEGLCSSIIDAMLLDCPVVATRAGGIPDLLGHDGQAFGRMTETRNSAELAQQVIELLQDSKATQRTATAARRYALQRFTADVMVEQTLNVFYDSINRACSEPAAECRRRRAA